MILIIIIAVLKQFDCLRDALSPYHKNTIEYSNALKEGAGGPKISNM
jgi:hypothetical protein